MTARPSTLARPLAAVLVGVAASLTSCSTAPPIGPQPGDPVPVVTPTPTPSSPAPPDSLKIEIRIDQKTVTPLRKEVDVRRGRTVVLVTGSDHDTTLRVKGPGIDRSEFIGRLTTVSTTFVADEPGVVTITSTDPEATIATLDVS